MSGNVTFGIIGAGMISHFHAKAINDAHGAKVISVFSTGSKNRKAFVQKHGVKGYDTLEAFLADPELDAVAIATPTGAHLEGALAAIRAGKHVMCEKPLETTPERAQKIIDAAHAHNVILAPVFQYRYTPAAQFMHKAIRNGRFGKIRMANARIKWFRPQSYYDSGAWRGTWDLDGGGCLMNQSIHAIDLLLHFAGRPTEVYGLTGTVGHENIEVEDIATAAVKFDNGALGVIESSTAVPPGWPMEIEVSGERGTARVTAEALTMWDFVDEDPVDAQAKEMMQTAATSSGASDPSAISTAGHQRIVENMVRTITTGKQFVIGGEEARLPIQLICGIYESVRTGAPVRL